MVRYATEDDLPRLLVLAQAEHTRSLWADTTFDPVATSETIRAFIGGAGRTLLTTQGGYLAGLIQPIGFSCSRTLALEYAWFAQDGSGMALLAAFERWAKRMGAFAVVVSEQGGAGRLSMVLGQRRGYGCIGESLVRRLED